MRVVEESYELQIKEILSKIEYEGIRRFEFVEGESDINISAEDSDGEVIFSERLIPVAHLYSLVRDVDFEEANSLKDYEIYVVGDLYEHI